MVSKGRVQEQITIELEQSAKTDATVVKTAIAINIVFLGINSMVAAWTSVGSREEDIETGGMTAILFVLIAIVAVINVVVARALFRGRDRRVNLTEKLGKLLKEEEEGMEEIYDSSLIEGYKSRYNMFTTVVLALGVAAVIVPIIALFSC
jgi:hypothetical protein